MRWFLVIDPSGNHYALLDHEGEEVLSWSRRMSLETVRREAVECAEDGGIPIVDCTAEGFPVID